MDKFMHIIWDFDGTLFDTYPHITSVIGNILKNEYNIDFSLENIHEWCLIELKYCFDKISSKFNLSSSEFQEHFKKNYMEDIETQQIPFPNAQEILHNVQKNGGKNFIITHRGIRSLSKLLKYNALSNYFEEIITKEDEFPKKPDPESFFYIINKYKLPKEKVLAIGDRDLDIKTAHSVNIRSCFFDPEGKTHELADFNIKDLNELERIL